VLHWKVGHSPSSAGLRAGLRLLGNFRFLTSGESHGRGLNVIVEGVPAGLPLTEDYLRRDMERRQKGYGRGGRMKIEKDEAKIIAGVRHGLNDGVAVPQAECHRLLQQDVLPGAGGGETMVGMPVGGAGDEDGIRVLSPQQTFQIGHVVDAEFLATLPTARFIVVPGGHDLRVFKVAHDVSVDADVPVGETDDAQLQSAHLQFLSSPRKRVSVA